LAAKQIEGRIYGTAQTVERLSDGGIRLSFRTTGVEAAQRWVLRFGMEAVLEAPAAAAAWVLDNLRQAVAQYSPSKEP
jgi:hypothetical protein